MLKATRSVAKSCSLESTLVALQSLATSMKPFGTILRKFQTPIQFASSADPKLTIHLPTTKNRAIAPSRYAYPKNSSAIRPSRGQKAKIVESLEKLGADYRTGGDHKPCVSASLTAEDTHKVAKSNHVGLITFDDRTVVLNLVDSIAISHADLPHSRGIDETGVNVAIFEEGPSDHYQLGFRKSLQPGPPASDHARLTSAIIKNVEPNKPHGYAPNCELNSESANIRDYSVV